MSTIALAGLPENAKLKEWELYAQTTIDNQNERIDTLEEIESNLRVENTRLRETIADQEQTIEAFSETISGLNEFGLEQDAENARLRAALEAYASRENWYESDIEDNPGTYIYDDLLPLAIASKALGLEAQP